MSNATAMKHIYVDPNNDIAVSCIEKDKFKILINGYYELVTLIPANRLFEYFYKFDSRTHFLLKQQWWLKHTMSKQDAVYNILFRAKVFKFTKEQIKLLFDVWMRYNRLDRNEIISLYKEVYHTADLKAAEYLTAQLPKEQQRELEKLELTKTKLWWQLGSWMSQREMVSVADILVTFKGKITYQTVHKVIYRMQTTKKQQEWFEVEKVKHGYYRCRKVK